MPPLAPKAYCYDCGKYIGRKWGEKKVHRCSPCLRIALGESEPEKIKDDIPY